MRWTVVGVCLAAAMVSRGEVVVSAHRVPTARADVSSSISTVSAEDIATLQRRDIPAAINRIPGVHVVRAGGPGQPATVFVRGSRIDDLVVLVDGIEINDPSLIGRNADVSLYGLADVARIEVLRGPQSALYGSDALGGVIDITTRRGEGPLQAGFRAEAGSYKTFREALWLSGSTGMVSYAVSASRLDTDGISAANEADGNEEDDGIGRTGLAGRLGLAPSEYVGLELTVRYLNEDVDYDAGAGPGADSEGNVLSNERVLMGASAWANLFDAHWQPRLSASLTKHNRDFADDWGDFWYNGSVARVGWQNDIYPCDMNALVLGAEHESETAESDGLEEVDSGIVSVYLQDRLTLGERAVLSAGGRWDDHDTFGDEFTYRVGATLKVPETGTRLKGTYGTAFKAPSLYQLYAPATAWGPVGNPDLKPQTSEGWDAGIEQDIAGGRAAIGATYFDTSYDDLIDFVAGYQNVGEADVSGVEVMARVDVCKSLRLDAAYTYTDSEDGNGEELSRRPEHRGSAGLTYTWNDRLRVGLEGLYVGDRRDAYSDAVTFIRVEENMPSYVLFNLAASYDVSRRVTVFGRLENLTDEDYEELAGYGTPGFSGYGGIEVTL